MDPPVASIGHENDDTQTLHSGRRSRAASRQVSGQSTLASSTPSFEPSSQTRLNRTAGPGLNEFRSLLEAAQRIASGASFGPDGGSWSPDDEQSDPVIRRSTGTDSLRRRVPLTRQYSGRPHVPGEDSGSESDTDDLGEQQQQEDQSMDDYREEGPPIRPGQADIGRSQIAGYSPSLNASDPVRTLGQQPRTSIERREQEYQQLSRRELVRQRASRDASEERQRRRDDNLVRARERARARDAVAIAAANDSVIQGRSRYYTREHYATTGPAPAGESLHDWAPEPAQTQQLTSDTDARVRSSSIRRWRPTERLQDYASSHARRDSVNDSNDGNQSSTPARQASDLYGVLDQATNTIDTRTLNHNDIVNRVERALQEYRVARGALSGVSNPTTSARDMTRNSSTTLRQIDPDLAASNIGSRLDHMDDIVGDNSTSYLRTAPQATLSASSNLSGTINTDRVRREEITRQRLRDLARERRRRTATLHDQESGASFASGPLFESSVRAPAITSPDADRLRTESRRILEGARGAEAHSGSKDLRQARSALQYLARLRANDMTSARAWISAAELGLHNQSLTEEVKKNIPKSISELPTPASCSWLEPGMTWTGTQSADEPAGKSSVLTVSADGRRRGEERDRGDIVARHARSLRARMTRLEGRNLLERTLPESQGSGVQDADSVTRDSMEALEEAERNLQSMLEHSERLLRENERQLQENEQQLARNRERLRVQDERLAALAAGRVRGSTIPRIREQATHLKGHDCWNVKVNLHEVDWQKMTISGTMTASHKPTVKRAEPGTTRDDNPEHDTDTSMNSFFTGEIIDFVTYGLDTPCSRTRDPKGVNNEPPLHKLLQDDWKVGGHDTDLTYWASIGPFKQEIYRAIHSRESELRRAAQQHEVDKSAPNAHSTTSGSVAAIEANDADSTTGMDGDKRETDPQITRDQAGIVLPIVLTEQERQDLMLKTMHTLLTDAQWLNANLNNRGWILMRWKERCFVSPGTTPNPEPTRPWIPSGTNAVFRGSISTPSSELLNSFSNNTTGSTSSPEHYARPITYIRYADLYNSTRERNAQHVYTTNAAERDEISSNTAGGSLMSARQTTCLTISGFYYVAMHRQTGEIEALYYDSSSAPFQRLNMSPAIGVSSSDQGHEADDMMNLDVDTENKSHGPKSCRPGGLKTNFNLVEFR